MRSEKRIGKNRLYIIRIMRIKVRSKFNNIASGFNDFYGSAFSLQFPTFDIKVL